MIVNSGLRPEKLGTQLAMRRGRISLKETHHEHSQGPALVRVELLSWMHVE